MYCLVCWNRAENEGKIHRAKISKTSYLCLNVCRRPDPLFKANVEEGNQIKNCLDLFRLWYGQIVNLNKSVIHYGKNVQVADRVSIGNILNIKSCQHDEKYLRALFSKIKSKTEAFRDIMEKIG